VAAKPALHGLHRVREVRETKFEDRHQVRAPKPVFGRRASGRALDPARS
jgi:hypothetical protein